MVMSGRPCKDTAAHRLLFEDLDDPTPGTHELIQKGIAEGGPMYFDETKPMPERGLHYKLTPAEREEIEKEIVENGWNSLCRCTQADFEDEDVDVRNRKAIMVNLYFEYGGDWARVFRDSRSVSRRAMAVYWRDDLFRSYIQALTPVLLLEARGVVVEVFREGLDEKARLAAALATLAALEPTTWDKGVRKQIVANKGSLESALFSRVISNDEVITGFIKDRLNKLPDDVRAALSQSLEKPAPQTQQQAPTSGLIQTADMSKLKDPFGEQNEPEEI